VARKNVAERGTTQLPKPYVGRVGPGGYERLPYIAREWKAKVSGGRKKKSKEKKKRAGAMVLAVALKILSIFFFL